MKTSDYVIGSVRLCLEVGNDEYFILCIFGGRSISFFKVEGGLRAPYPGRKKQKIAQSQNRVNINHEKL